MDFLNFLTFCQKKHIQLSLVEEQLKVNAPPNILTPEVIERLKHHKPELVALLKNKPAELLAREDAIQPIVRDEALVLSCGQEQLWLTNELDNVGDIYHFVQVLDFSGALNVEALTASFSKIITRHESLRTTIHDTGGKLTQRVMMLLNLIWG
jgi:hypothetical protein